MSGFAGGLASVDRKTKVSFWAKFISILSGSFSANYLTPLIGSWMDLRENAMFGLAFMVGYGGLKFIEIIYQRFIRTVSIDKTNNNPKE